jgi:hypothetical protein
LESPRDLAEEGCQEIGREFRVAEARMAASNDDW